MLNNYQVVYVGGGCRGTSPSLVLVRPLLIWRKHIPARDFSGLSPSLVWASNTTLIITNVLSVWWLKMESKSKYGGNAKITFQWETASNTLQFRIGPTKVAINTFTNCRQQCNYLQNVQFGPKSPDFFAVFPDLPAFYFLFPHTTTEEFSTEDKPQAISTVGACQKGNLFLSQATKIITLLVRRLY